MTLCLPCDHDCVERTELLDEVLVPLTEPFPVRALENLGPDGRVVLRERTRALDPEVEIARAHDRVEKECILDSRDQCVPEAAEEGVERPHREPVLPSALEAAGVVGELAPGVLLPEPEAPADVRVHPP
jgi:hypothetical protein